jgi:hypothetical protein
MLSEDLQIFRDAYELARLLFVYGKDVPKHVRYGEWAKAQSLVFEVMDMIYTANSSKEERHWALTRVLMMIGGVRSRVRLFGELRFVNPRRAALLQHRIEGITKQAIGWRNSSRYSQSQ